VTGALSWADVRTATGDGVRIAVIDSGIDASHPEFAATPIDTYRVEQPWPDSPFRRVIECPDCQDQLGHGTAVASIVRRFAPGAALSTVQIFGTGKSTSASALTALRWAIDRRFAVVNCSFGTSDRRMLAEFKELIDLAFCRGLVVVAASNNNDYRLPELPSAFPSVVATSWGSFDGLMFSRNSEQLVEFTAAGESLRVAWKGGGYREGVCGSSFAAPHMAAVCARIKQLRPEWNAVQVKACLYALAQQKSGSGVGAVDR
jgi:subtilisin family serine protease